MVGALATNTHLEGWENGEGVVLVTEGKKKESKDVLSLWYCTKTASTRVHDTSRKKHQSSCFEGKPMLPARAFFFFFFFFFFSTPLFGLPSLFLPMKPSGRIIALLVLPYPSKPPCLLV